MTEFRIGRKDSWRYKNWTYAIRAITDESLASLYDNGNRGTVVTIDDKSYYGKTVILKNIKFEMIDKGYAVGYGIQADAQLLIQFLNKITDRFTFLKKEISSCDL